MSKTQVLLPIVGAVEKADDFLGGHRTWQAVNTTQGQFLDRIYRPTSTLVQAIPEIESVAARSAEEINAFLLKKGFSIRLDPFTDPRDFGVASVLDVLVEWIERGDVHPIRAMGRQFEGVRIPVKRRRVAFLHDRAFPNPIACLTTKSGDRVYLTVLDASRVPDLIASSERLPSLDHSGEKRGFGGVIFPMVSLDQEVDISWLRGLSTIGTDGLLAIVTQALQQTKFRMNEVGARAESAVALGVMRGAAMRPDPDLIIDQPFCCWIERPGIPVPLFFGHITEEDWRNPGSLGR
ncbi:MAG: serpin family protein [bacterium]|nr:serpin family protein [bacterium]